MTSHALMAPSLASQLPQGFQLPENLWFDSEPVGAGLPAKGVTPL